MTVRVAIPSQLRGYTDGRASVEARGATLADVFADLDARFPGFRFRVLDEHDRVRRHMLVFVGGERCEDLTAPLPADAEVFLAGALSGG